MKEFSERFKDKLRDKVLAECRTRGLPTFLDLAKNGATDLELRDHQHSKHQGEHIVLLYADGWAKYSRRFMAGLGWNGVYRELAILGGTGRQGTWATRVPATYRNVDGALDWLKPAAVRNHPLKVLRQGDIWILERTRGNDDLRELPSSHTWDAETRTLAHNGHGVLHVPFPFRAIPQRTLAADGRYRRQGD